MLVDAMMVLVARRRRLPQYTLQRKSTFSKIHLLLHLIPPLKCELCLAPYMFALCSERGKVPHSPTLCTFGARSPLGWESLVSHSQALCASAWCSSLRYSAWCCTLRTFQRAPGAARSGLSRPRLGLRLAFEQVVLRMPARIPQVGPPL